MKGRNSCVTFPVVKLQCWPPLPPLAPLALIVSYSRMLLNQSADWSRGEINVMPGLIEFFWTPDIIIYDLVRSVDAKKEILIFPP